MISQLKPLMGKFTNFAQNKMGFDYPPKLFLKQDLKNAKSALGKTAYYDPQNKAITIFVTGRHPKDILRSFAHELVHHTQNLRGDLSPEKCGEMSDKYAQENPHMRKMEEEAYLVGNMCFRDWEDSENFTIQESKMLKENKTMTTKITRKSLKNMIQTILEEKMKTVNEDGNMFAPNHYCVHHGGVQHEGKIVAAEAVQHNYDETLGKVTHYDMKLPDGTILENVAAEDIQVTNATLEGSHSGKRDDGHKPVKKVKKMSEAEEDVEEGYKMSDPRSAQAPAGYDEDDREFNYDEDEDDLGPEESPVKIDGLNDRELLSLIRSAVELLSDPDETMEEGEEQDEDKPEPRKEKDPKYDDDLYDDDHDNEIAGVKKEQSGEEESVEEEVKNPGKYKTGMKAGYDKDGDGVPNGADENPEDGSVKESKIQTPEQENALYENRFSKRNANLFEDLVKKWAK